MLPSTVPSPSAGVRRIPLSSFSHCAYDSSHKMASMRKTSLFAILYHFWIMDQFSIAASENSDNDNTNWNTKDYQKREHCLTKPYHHGSAGGRPLWDFGGSAMITSNYVRLTADKQGSKGYIWNSVPVHLRSWEMHVHFKVWSQNKKDLFGDGLAFWYTKDRMQPGNDNILLICACLLYVRK